MNRNLLAGIALVGGLAVAAPTVAPFAAGPDPDTVQAPSGPSGADGGGERGMRERGDGPMGWRHRWMMRGMEDRTPRERCEERLARRAGFRAYIVAKLNLTSEQRPLWDKLQGQLQTSDDRERQLCATLKPMDEHSSTTLLDRVDHREQVLTTKLQALQSEKPAIQALYQALTPEQRAIVDHPFRR